MNKTTAKIVSIILTASLILFQPVLPASVYAEDAPNNIVRDIEGNVTGVTYPDGSNRKFTTNGRGEQQYTYTYKDKDGKQQQEVWTRDPRSNTWNGNDGRTWTGTGQFDPATGDYIRKDSKGTVTFPSPMDPAQRKAASDAMDAMNAKRADQYKKWVDNKLGDREQLLREMSQGDSQALNRQLAQRSNEMDKRISQLDKQRQETRTNEINRLLDEAKQLSRQVQTQTNQLNKNDPKGRSMYDDGYYRGWFNWKLHDQQALDEYKQKKAEIDAIRAKAWEKEEQASKLQSQLQSPSSQAERNKLQEEKKQIDAAGKDLGDTRIPPDLRQQNSVLGVVISDLTPAERQNAWRDYEQRQDQNAARQQMQSDIDKDPNLRNQAERLRNKAIEDAEKALKDKGVTDDKMRDMPWRHPDYFQRVNLFFSWN